MTGTWPGAYWPGAYCPGAYCPTTFGAGVDGIGTFWPACAGVPLGAGGCGGAAGDCGASATFHAPLTQTHPLPPCIQCPGTQTELLVGGRSQCAATHFHCPPSELQWPDIHTYAGEGAGPIV
jgi:hypothetical protein